MNDLECQLRSGYLSFSRADLAQSVATGTSNVKSYELMIEATKTNASYKTRSSEAVNEIYPLTAEAVEVMSQKLAEAEAAADNPKDETFRSRLNELKRIASWSARRQSVYSWLIIAGGFLWMLFYFLTTIILAGPDYGVREAKVKAWSDTPPRYKIEEVKDNYNLRADKYGSATNYKLFCLKDLANAYFKVKHNCEETEKTLRYGTLSDSQKEIYTHNMEVYATNMEKAKADFDAADALSFDQWQQKALEEVGGGLNSERSRNANLYLMITYFAVIIVLYVLTNRPKGYMLSRQRTTARIAGGLLKVLFAVISWLGISGARMGWTDPDKIVTVWWSDGSITKHLVASDLINSSAMFKIIFYVAALTFLMFGSAYLLPILTIIGFFINVDRKRKA